jgi:hypothetical protein
MTVAREVIRKNISGKGFIYEPNKDHDYFYLHNNGRKTSIWIRLSRGTGYKVYSDSLLGRQAKIIGVSLSDFKKFVICTYSQEDFIKILIRNGRL